MHKSNALKFQLIFILRIIILAYQTGFSVSFTHAGNFIWHGGGVPDELHAMQWHA
jgi:hypothetical protein